MIALREVMTDADYHAWRQIRLAVAPDGAVPSVARLRAGAAPERLLLLATLDGEVVGAGMVGPSDQAGRAAVTPRVLPHARRRGVGGALLYGLAAHATEQGFPLALGHTDDAVGVAFGARFGFVEVERQAEQVRPVGVERSPALPAGVWIVSVAEQPHRWPEAYESVARGALAGLPGQPPVTPAQWQREWLTDPAAMFVALAGDGVIGCAGLLTRAGHPERAEHGLTAVRPQWRRRGVATALTRHTLAWAARNGVREVVARTRRGGEDLRRLNERLGYAYRAQSIALQAPLPL
ncbi:GNAT family N-acetyltransferase [Rhizomonospora bruguierae]|uniref:GNAT family N-acetyltransferase n=1 Tax=Rhizomonospora bruguierae TaxID=1581705 RepID=UPI001BD15286|nr:GNAT family N-acetyltransferase [Micromonospora sp. NBRC 107566]